MAGVTTACPKLLSPLTLNQVTVKNRIVSTAHATAYAVGGYPKERYRHYSERKARGDADLIGMTRALIVDPDLPKKALAGEPEEIRRCTGANEGSIGRLYQGLPIRCVQNPLIGREDELDGLLPAPVSRRVVGGGGPAGMAAARVAAERGHDVTLFEQAAAPGGHARRAVRGGAGRGAGPGATPGGRLPGAALPV